MNDVSTLGQTGSAVRADRTSTGKEHFEVLDGLRGSAAILIVIFHVFNYSFGWDTPLSLMHHAYLAVDFFFGLSGFVPHAGVCRKYCVLSDSSPAAWPHAWNHLRSFWPDAHLGCEHERFAGW